MARLLHAAKSASEGVSAGHILVVDDEAAMRDIAARVLREEGYSVSTAANGAEALVELSDRRPDGVLLDLNMPELNGEEFLSVCRETPAFADLPIALCSSSARAERVARTYGVSVVIDKPFDLDELIDQVARLVPPEMLAPVGVPNRLQNARAVAAETRARTAALVLNIGRTELCVEHSKGSVYAARRRLAELSLKLALGSLADSGWQLRLATNHLRSRPFRITSA